MTFMSKIAVLADVVCEWALNTEIEEVLTLSGKLFHKGVMDGTNDEYK